jgi:arginine utilization protein RocB
MKKITFNQPLFFEQPLQVRNNREQLILEIVNRTDAKNKKALARRISIVSNQFGWSDMDLHALAHKKDVKNYSAFVNWSLKSHAKS